MEWCMRMIRNYITAFELSAQAEAITSDESWIADIKSRATSNKFNLIDS